MEEIKRINGFIINLLDKNTAEKYKSQIVEMVEQIPLVDYTEEDIITEVKGERKMYCKWEHSLIVFDQTKPVAVIISYERKAEGSQQYPENTIYISELAVKKEYQNRGIAKKLVRTFLEYNNNKGFICLEGVVNFSVQTNSAKWNQHVQALYESFGFEQRAKKKYNNRLDVILSLCSTD